MGVPGARIPSRRRGLVPGAGVKLREPLGCLAVGKRLAADGRRRAGEGYRPAPPRPAQGRRGRNQLRPWRDPHDPSHPSVLPEGAGTPGLPPPPGRLGSREASATQLHEFSRSPQTRRGAENGLDSDMNAEPRPRNGQG